MEAYRIDRFGSIDGIVLRSSEDPRPGSKEILMRVRASSLNYRDLMVLKAGGRGPTKLGVVPLSDGAGEVAAIGEGVTRAKIGDRIAGCFHPRWFGGPIKPDYLTDRLGTNLDGMLAEYAVFNEEAVVVLPSHLSFEEAATLPCAAVTAWVALTGHRGRHSPDPRFGGRFDLCAAVCPGVGRSSDRDDLDRGKGRAAQGAGGLRGDQLHRDARLGREGARTDRWPRRRLRRRDRRTGNDREVSEGLAVGGHVGRIMLGIKKEAILDRRRVSQTPDGASIDTVTFETYGNLFPSETEDQTAMQHLQPRIVG